MHLQNNDSVANEMHETKTKKIRVNFVIIINVSEKNTCTQKNKEKDYTFLHLSY